MTVTANSGAGTGASASITGTDQAGIVACTTGSNPAKSGYPFSLSLVTPAPVAMLSGPGNYPVWRFFPVNSHAQSLYSSNLCNANSGDIAMGDGLTGPDPNTEYIFSYSVSFNF